MTGETKPTGTSREAYLESVIAAWEIIARQKDDIIDQLFGMFGARAMSGEKPSSAECNCIKCELKREGKWK